MVQAKEDGDKPGLEAMLQKVLQLYASRVLSKRSYAKKGNNFVTVTQLVQYEQECITWPPIMWEECITSEKKTVEFIEG